MFGIELGWSAAHLMLSFQTGARETVLSYYPELAASWGWSPTVGSFTLFAGPLVGVGMLVIDQVAQAQQSAGVNIRYGGLLQVGWCFHKRFSLVLGGFLGASSTQQRTDEGVGWKTSFSFRGTFGLRWYL